MPRVKAGLGLCQGCGRVKILYKNAGEKACKICLNKAARKARKK